MKLDKTLITRLKTLARMEISSDCHDQIISHLETIITYINQLSHVDASNVRPATGARPGKKAVLREDRLEAGLERRDVIEQAPDADGHFFRVPRVIGKEDQR